MGRRILYPNATLTPDEKDYIWQAAKAHVDRLHNQDQDSPVADEAVLQLDPHWTYQPRTQVSGDSII